MTSCRTGTHALYENSSRLESRDHVTERERQAVNGVQATFC